MIKLIVGPGNPGSEYAMTRHNLGFMALDTFAEIHSLRWRKGHKGLYGDCSFASNKVVFLKPLTYMNRSGESVQSIAHFFKINPKEILVIHDDLDIPYGKILLKKGGGLAGHNGLKSIASSCGSQDFLRIRMGISRPEHGDVVSWVLTKFSVSEEKELNNFLENTAKVLEVSLKEGFEKAQALYNRKSMI